MPAILIPPRSSQTMSRIDLVRKNYLVKRDSPNIGGSVGGFIAVVVCLVLVIVVSCTAAFWILRSGPPSKEHTKRRPKSHYQHQSVPSSSSLQYNNSSNTSPSWSGKLGKMLGIRGQSTDTAENSSTTLKGREGRGWMHAGSGDEWDYDSGDEPQQSPAALLTELRVTQMQDSTVRLSPTLDTPLHPAVFQTFPTSNSNSNIRVDLHAVPGLSSKHTQSPSPQSTLPNAHTHFSSTPSSSAPSPIPIRSASPEHMPGSSADNLADNDSRKFSTQSGVSMRTFQGGTKFIESL